MTAVPLNIASPDCAEPFFRGPTARCVPLHHAASLDDLRAVLEHLHQDDRRRGVSGPVMTLDLIGHSTREHRLLRLGATVIDMLDPHVARAFRALDDTEVLPRLGITAVRLLGCGTATTESGRLTLRMLAHTLALPVFGTTAALLKSHSNAHGFDPTFSHLLVEASCPDPHDQPHGPAPAFRTARR